MIRKYKVFIAFMALFMAYTIGLLIVSHQGNKINDNRSVGQINNCAILKGLVKAGRHEILLGTIKPSKIQETSLQNLGFPPYDARKAEAIKQANDYINIISNTVIKETGVKNGFAVKNNTVDCSQLRKVSGLGKKPNE